MKEGIASESLVISVIELNRMLPVKLSPIVLLLRLLLRDSVLKIIQKLVAHRLLELIKRNKRIFIVKDRIHGGILWVKVAPIKPRLEGRLYLLTQHLLPVDSLQPWMLFDLISASFAS